ARHLASKPEMEHSTFTRLGLCRCLEFTGIGTYRWQPTTEPAYPRLDENADIGPPGRSAAPRVRIKALGLSLAVPHGRHSGWPIDWTRRRSGRRWSGILLSCCTLSWPVKRFSGTGGCHSAILIDD